jgi:putative membrane protein
MQKRAAAFIFISMVFVAFAAYAASGKAEPSNKLAGDDEAFMKEAAQGGQMEVRLGETAAKNGRHDRVKAFGKRMQEDHGKANKELAALAKKKNVVLSKSLEGKQKSEVERLMKLSGDEFDREYMQAMVKDHKEDIEKFERAAKNAKDSDVKSFASKQLPTLKQHLELAERTNKELSKGGSAATKSK